MKCISVFLVTVLLLCLAGCGGPAAAGETTSSSIQESAPSSALDPGISSSSAAVEESDAPPPDAERASMPAESIPVGGIEPQEALALALKNASVPEQDAYNIQIERDEESGVPVYDIEFETDYGDYQFEVASADGQIVGADYEVDEEWLSKLGGGPVSLEEAKALIQEKVPGGAPDALRIWEEAEDGRGRFEGEWHVGDMKYEFEIDPQTGIIFDWNADKRG